MRHLLMQEFAQKDGDQLVREAVAAVKAQEGNIEPDLALLTTADFQSLGGSTVDRGKKAVEAFQTALIDDTGRPGLTDEELQNTCADGLNDIQLSDHLIQHAIKLRRRGLSKISAAVLGSPAGGFYEFLVDMFSYGSTRSGTAAAPESLAGSIAGSTVDATELSASATMPPPPSPARSTSSAAGQDDDFCPLAECKLVYPHSEKELTMSGVPDEMVSPRTSQGKYLCMWDECDYEAHGKPACATHVRRKHYGIALGCPVSGCSKRFYKPKGWTDHLATHTSFPKAMWFRSPEAGGPSSFVDQELDPGYKALAATLASHAVEAIFNAPVTLAEPPAKRARVEADTETVEEQEAVEEQGAMEEKPAEEEGLYTYCQPARSASGSAPPAPPEKPETAPAEKPEDVVILDLDE